MFQIREAQVPDIPVIQQIAEKTWWPTYSSILSEEQLRYMLAVIYSTEAIQTALDTHSQVYLMLSDARGPQGFASYSIQSQQPFIVKLNKLYVLPDNHGKGYGKILVEEIKSRASALGATALQLNVNRYNRARSFYEKIGFQVIAEEDVPVGPYWMNDFVMKLELK
jgi:GNAT superfamily N-acetyltransferase